MTDHAVACSAVIGDGCRSWSAAGLRASPRRSTLARAGLRRHRRRQGDVPRDKCCGDGLTTLALRELEALGFDPSTVPNWFDGRRRVAALAVGREVLRAAADRTGTFAAIAPAT